jgi:Ca2+-binding RTX toxin-like protein
MALIDLSTLTASEGFRIIGDAAFDYAGRAVSSAGDINGDGFDDILIGAWGNDAGGSGAGSAYVIFGHASGFSNIDLATLSATDGFEIIGDTDLDSTGISVSSAGDLNGDGYDDMIIGAAGNDGGGSAAGAAYVIFGKASGFGTIDLTSLAAADGFKIVGENDVDIAGQSVSSAGDVNGDGFDDLIIGSRYNDAGGSNAGAAYIIFGKETGFANIDLASLAIEDGFKIIGDAASDETGISVSSAGDVNGDGFDDVIIGAFRAFGGGTYGSAGMAYVIFGKASGFATVDLTTLGTSEGFRLIGPTSYDWAGFSVSSAGDINGDGFDEVIVSAPYNEIGGNYAGTSYVIFGKASGSADIDLETLASDQGFRIVGETGYDFSGWSVSNAGDVNGDGFDDIIIGARGNDEGGSLAGAAYVIYGKTGGFGDVDLSTLSDSDGFKIVGDAVGDQAGTSVSAAGDINGDGIGDLLVGSDTNDGGGTDAGATYVLFGQAPTEEVARTGSSIGQTIVGGAFDDTLNGRGGDDRLLGGGGNDTLLGGTGNDILDGGTGADTSLGGTGNDTYVVDNSEDFLFERVGEGFDTVRSSITFSLAANLENLELIGTGNINGTGNDLGNLITGNAGRNVLQGLGGNDALSGGANADTLNGGDGNDSLDGGGGSDILDGGTGIDTASYQSATTGVTVSLAITAAQATSGAGTDTLANLENLTGSAFSDHLTGNSGANVLTGLDGNDTLTSGAGTDTLDGGDGVDRLFGGGSNDTLIGGAGTDVLDGGSGDDSLSGGTGNDSYTVDSNGDTVTEGAGEGTDTVKSSVSITLGSNLEKLQLLGTGNINGTGNELANTMTGNSGANMLLGAAANDTINGAGGNDIIEGGAGKDVLTGGTGTDLFVFRDGDFGNTANLADKISDFTPADGDKIDLHFIDSNTLAAGNQGFSFIGTGAFTHVAGELRYQEVSGSTYIYGDMDGDGTADMVIRLTGSHALVGTDFVL